MSEKIATFAPIKVTVEFALTDGNMVAQAGFDCPPGELPTANDIERAAQSVLRQVQDQLGEAFVFQTRHGFVSDLLAERAGGVRFAIPGPDEWLASWADGETSTSETAA
jgi:hypothetical protein